MNGCLFFKRRSDLAQRLLPEEIESFLRMEQELPDLTRELHEIQEFLGQYKENFEILPSFGTRFRITMYKVRSFIHLISKFYDEMTGEVKWH